MPGNGHKWKVFYPFVEFYWDWRDAQSRKEGRRRLLRAVNKDVNLDVVLWSRSPRLVSALHYALD
jgi:hypothetical protein